VDAENWAEICDEVRYEIETLTVLHDPPEFMEDTFSLMFEAVNDGIGRVDFVLCSVFVMVYEEARCELGI
jgi:hypothetical protein